MHAAQLGAQPGNRRRGLLQRSRRPGLAPRPRRQPVAPLVEHRDLHPQILRHLPHGALALQRQFDRPTLVVFVVMLAQLVLARFAFAHGVAGAALIPTRLFTKIAHAHSRPVGLRAVGSASFMNNPAVCPPSRGNLKCSFTVSSMPRAYQPHLAGYNKPLRLPISIDVYAYELELKFSIFKRAALA